MQLLAIADFVRIPSVHIVDFGLVREIGAVGTRVELVGGARPCTSHRLRRSLGICALEEWQIGNCYGG